MPQLLIDLSTMLDLANIITIKKICFCILAFLNLIILHKNNLHGLFSQKNLLGINISKFQTDNPIIDKIKIKVTFCKLYFIYITAANTLSLSTIKDDLTTYFAAQESIL